MYICSSCQYSSSTKLGKCPDCKQFGTFIKDSSKPTYKEKKNKHTISTGNTLIHDSSRQSSIFWGIEDKELQRTFHKGIKQGGVYLLAGEPGIGKSTLVLQIINQLVSNNKISLGYFTGEENESQVAARFQRISQKQTEQTPFDLFHATHFEDIIATAIDKEYDMIVLDSIQTVYSPHNDSPAGSPNQVRYCSEKLSEHCKKHNLTVLVIGHVNKGGEIAGPKYLEHIVDVVLYLEGDRFGQLRFLRTKKNRFGHTDDTGIFDMKNTGLTAVYDLKERIINNAHLNVPGNVLTIGLDSGRPVIANLEVLLTQTNGKYLTRNCVGVNPKRVDMIIAIIQKYLQAKLFMFDIYINVPGEFTFFDSGMDLAIAAAIMSQYHNKPIKSGSIFLGELGLSGHVSPTKFHAKRKREIPQGFSLIDKDNIKNIRDIEQFL